MKRKRLKYPFFVIIGPSGSGKTSVAEAVFPAEFKVISHTTRPIRKEEKDGIDYYFETKEQFKKLVDTDALAENDQYHGYQYGVGIEELIRKTTSHFAYDVLTIDGFQQIERQFGNKVIPIFFKVSKKNILARLQTREDDNETVKERSALYDVEAQNIEKVITYPNHCIINADQPFETVIDELKSVIMARNLLLD
ncbi:guanylate kinase [Enterococcus ureilyticus]|uniref:Guanylate kinase n=1 Tax=Enterococcus ureilyticus TaxID=1131292 RepID=A0A1E5HCV3_9ENTE|nr:guanylate kinase [Enterococcus ureilyticus]MBM7687833.1 guanylate kinase [Enterococcus ureilyticus]MBO0447030.1 guanylate kinase [Enterococcus ureilyticus]OEG22666.1 guanylate kinase [Enterococcus ureilyticus]